MRKKVMAVILSTVLLVAFAAFPVLNAANETTVSLYTGGTKFTADEGNVEWLDDPNQVGVKFTVPAAGMTGFVVKEVPTFGEANTRKQTLQLYRWDTDYTTTIAGTKLHEETKTIPNDGADMTYTFSSKMEAGEYLVVLTNTSDTPGSCVYRMKDGTPAAGVSFYYGKELLDNKGYAVEYITTATNPSSGDASLMVSFAAAALVAVTLLLSAKRRGSLVK